jgi:hypothetical protein
MNSLPVEFGIGTASVIDSLIIRWPSGLEQRFANVTPNVYYNLTEGQPLGVNNVYSGIPEKYSLSQNYPNPFNPTTNIKYQIANSSNVVLSVYNMLGKKVVTLVNQKQNAGFYEVTFDGTNLSSGIYFYKLTCTGQDNFSETKKMILLK